MTSLPPLIDLYQVARDLGARKDCRRLVDTIRRFGMLQSCLADLAQAIDTLEALEWLKRSPRGVGSDRRAATENALLATVVMLYCRATVTAAKHGERGSIDIRPHLNDGQRADHDQLALIRNRALAHVYAGERIGDDLWHRESVFLAQHGPGWVIGGLTHRVQLDAKTVETARRQIPVAHGLLDEMVGSREQHFLTAFREAWPDQTVQDAFRSAGFAMAERMGSEAAAAAALASIGSRRARGLISG